jgi:hypothetical protein
LIGSCPHFCRLPSAHHQNEQACVANVSFSKCPRIDHSCGSFLCESGRQLSWPTIIWLPPTNKPPGLARTLPPSRREQPETAEAPTVSSPVACGRARYRRRWGKSTSITVRPPSSSSGLCDIEYPADACTIACHRTTRCGPWISRWKVLAKGNLGNICMRNQNTRVLLVAAPCWAERPLLSRPTQTIRDANNRAFI